MKRNKWSAHDGKIVYATQEEAKIAAYVMRRKKGVMIRAYKCPYGNHWHCGGNGSIRLLRISQILDSLKEKGEIK